MKKNEKSKLEFVLIGNTYNSIKRAEQKSKELTDKGYILLNCTNKKLTFKKQ